MYCNVSVLPEVKDGTWRGSWVGEHRGIDSQVSDNWGIDSQVSDNWGIDSQVSDNWGIDSQVSKWQLRNQ